MVLMRRASLALGAAMLLVIASIGSVGAGYGPPDACAGGDVGDLQGASAMAPYGADRNPGMNLGISGLCNPT